MLRGSLPNARSPLAHGVGGTAFGNQAKTKKQVERNQALIQDCPNGQERVASLKEDKADLQEQLDGDESAAHDPTMGSETFALPPPFCVTSRP